MLSVGDSGAGRLPSDKRHRGRLPPVSAQPGAALGRAGGSGGAQRRGGRGRALRFPRFRPPAAPRERGGGGGTGRERSSEPTALSTAHSGTGKGRETGTGTGRRHRTHAPGCSPGRAPPAPLPSRSPARCRRFSSARCDALRCAPIGPSPALPASVRSGSIPSDAAHPGAAHPGSTGLVSPRPSRPAPSRHTPGARRYLRGSARCRRSVRPGARALPPGPTPLTSQLGAAPAARAAGGAQCRGGVRSPPLPAGLAPVPRSRGRFRWTLKRPGGPAGGLGPEGGGGGGQRGMGGGTRGNPRGSRSAGSGRIRTALGGRCGGGRKGSLFPPPPTRVHRMVLRCGEPRPLPVPRRDIEAGRDRPRRPG